MVMTADGLAMLACRMLVDSYMPEATKGGAYRLGRLYEARTTAEKAIALAEAAGRAALKEMETSDGIRQSD